jgi:signal transduction histidine kinase
MNKLSLKAKVTIWYTSILIVLSFFILYAMTGISQSILVRDLEEKMVVSVNDFSKQIKMHDLKGTIIPEHLLYSGGVQLAIYDENGHLEYGRHPFGLESEIKFEDNTLKTCKQNNLEYYIYDKLVKRNSDNVYIRGAVCLSNETQAIQSAVQYNLLSIIIFIFLAGFGGYLIISRSFVPVNKIRLTAKEISESSDLSRRIEIGEGGDEIHALAKTFDEMLEKIEKSFNKEKQFTSDASHELRTPISVILSECEYGIECVEDVEELKETLSSVKLQATKMSKLVSELLMISRMDSNRLKLNFEDTDISELLNFVCEEQEEIQIKDIKLIQNIEQNIFANVDRLLLTRLFVNLISNAYQYSNDGSNIIVTLKEIDNKIEFSVKDEGIGISEENIPKIWDRFYQVDSSRTEERNGSSGLGLPMVKWISDCHNGKLEVISEIDKGSTFIFRIDK